MKYTNNDIEQLIDKFFEGQTSNTEEEALYEHFDLNDFPDHLEHYKPLFEFHKYALDHGVAPHRENISIDIPKKIRIPYIAAFAAASVAILALLLPAITTEASSIRYPFEGSYMIVNGNKITDMEILMPEIEKTLTLTSTIKEQIENLNEDVWLQLKIHDHYSDSEF